MACRTANFNFQILNCCFCVFFSIENRIWSFVGRTFFIKILAELYFNATVAKMNLDPIILMKIWVFHTLMTAWRL